MSSLMSEADLRIALEGCASEPIHIPGTVQPFACLIAKDPDSHKVSHVSENASDILAVEPQTLLGADLRTYLGADVWHAVKNAFSLPASSKKSHHLGQFAIGDRMLAIHAFQSNGSTIFELEHAQPADLSGARGFKMLSGIMEDIETCTSEDELFQLTTELLRHVTGFDRIMIYSFDSDWNGQVLAEDRRSGLESYEGLRFPHWDIPRQARAMMEKIPLRIIEHVHQTPVPIRTETSPRDPLDISLAVGRGVSAVHMEYLKNMGVEATMTVTAKVDGKLWGMISFHHTTQRVVAPDLRDLLVSIGRVFSSKLQMLLQQRKLQIIEKVDGLRSNLLDMIGEEDGFDTFAKSVFEIMAADGIYAVRNGRIHTAGLVPGAPLVDHLRTLAQEEGGVTSFENLGDACPSFSNSLNGCAGAVAFAPDKDSAMLIFRGDQTRTVKWAGNPEKTTQVHQGSTRLSPRGSFSVFLQEVKGTSRPWQDEELYFARRIWSLFNSVERSVMITSLNRQQQIMIEELNHRVRNILALIRSVSKQAQRSSYGSLESYSKSLESRIQALAASHDLASGSVVATVPVITLISGEFDPFGHENGNQYEIIGTAGHLRAEIAPIFSLVIHELVTNAVKYGALSNEAGRVKIVLTETAEGLEIKWSETGGPPVVEPAEFGFGTTLIQQAIPHELDGEAQLDFNPQGVSARFFVPIVKFQAPDPDDQQTSPEARSQPSKAPDIDLTDTTALLLEDNFVIARGTRDQLKSLGVAEVEMVANEAAALAFIDTNTPSFAILDVNLGGDASSEKVAGALMDRGIPFFFVTGYGERTAFPAELKFVPRLRKPVMNSDLLQALAAVLRKPL